LLLFHVSLVFAKGPKRNFEKSLSAYLQDLQTLFEKHVLKRIFSLKKSKNCLFPAIMFCSILCKKSLKKGGF